MCGYDTTYFERGSNSARALRLYRNRFPQQTVQHNLKKHNFFPAYHERYMLFLKTTLSVGLNFVLTLLVS
jgi:hypothetical protein